MKLKNIKFILSCISVSLVAILFIHTNSGADLQVSPNNVVKLKAYSDLGIPLHPASGERSVQSRLQDGSIANILQIDTANGWIEIKSGNQTGWIISKYIGEILPTEVHPSVAGVYTVGCWNLEWFHDGKTRGFPENTNGGPTYPSRHQEDYVAIAAIIESLDLKILILEEIYAQKENKNGEEAWCSKEMNRLIDILGASNYDYIISETGGSQHIAILWDKRSVRLNDSYETNFENEKVNGDSLFSRQPLFGHFTFLNNNQPMNDLEIVGVHLSSGQGNTKNHDAAMKILVDKIHSDKINGSHIPPDENDIFIMGDFNASRFDSQHEQFWDEMESNGWDVLADNEESYPATRLSGKPLGLKDSKIDYIIISKGNNGLAEEEINENEAKVHTELLNNDPEGFRSKASDHLPVTISVKIMNDTDSSNP
jgi:endonuclease/exonuclease/phosphatase family metal-dependent hydrolase